MLRVLQITLLQCVLFHCAVSFADDSGLEFFEKKIRPVLIDNCYECHSAEADEPGGGLLLDSREGVRAGGETGPAVVPKDLQDSLLLSAMEYRDLEMPPDQKLAPEIIADFRTWIQMGAPDSRTDSMADESEAEDESAAKQPLWSLQPVTSPSPPELGVGSLPQSAIDRFVLARLAAAGLTPARSAPPDVLLRRVTFDLIGLPPAPEEVAAFAAAPTQEAFTRYVQQLLNSPQFGERWARHWLDVVRYGESAGSSRDVLMLYSWRYRDYVIEAFNSDLPYREFIREQIAGDLLPADSEEIRRRRLIATGLLALGSKSLNGGNLGLDIPDDQIDVVGKAVLGLTISCARCHDHKFDPIPTADYYALAGIFRSTETFYGGSTNRPKNLQDQLKVYLPLTDDTADTARQLQKLETQIAAIRKSSGQLQKRLPKLMQQLPKNWEDLVPHEDRTPGVDAPAVAPKVRKQLDQYRQAKAELEELNIQLKDLDAQRQALPAPEFAFGVRDVDKPRDWPIQIRGEKGKNGNVVPRGFLSCVNLPETVTVSVGQSGRLQLADWITHPDHPLTSRVLVNRVWQHLFGRGLVESVNNFGTSGSLPTHPQLLDYLAYRFVHHHQWSVKSLIREIVLTRTYQMSSDVSAEGWDIDPANELLWRANRRRLEAEAIRDAMLAASGQLDLHPPAGSRVQQIGEGEVGRNIKTGPLEEPFPYRSVYLPIIRGLLPEMLKVFDFPDPANSVGQRSETNVPTQSLFLLNSEFVQTQAAELATRVRESSSDDHQRVNDAWQMCLSRLPQDDEVADALQLVQRMAAQGRDTSDVDPWQVLCQSLLASAEFRFID